MTGSIVRENGTSNSQAKEAWPSLQTGQTNSKFLHIEIYINKNNKIVYRLLISLFLYL